MKKSRAFKRYKSTDELQASIEKFQTNVLNINPLSISLVDISEGGLCVDLKEPLPIDQHVNLEVSIHEQLFSLIARVVWNDKEDNYYKVGLELVYVDPLFVFELKGLVDELKEHTSNN